jgi:hypothetical protein
MPHLSLAWASALATLLLKGVPPSGAGSSQCRRRPLRLPRHRTHPRNHDRDLRHRRSQGRTVRLRPRIRRHSTCCARSPTRRSWSSSAPGSSATRWPRALGDVLAMITSSSLSVSGAVRPAQQRDRGSRRILRPSDAPPGRDDRRRTDTTRPDRIEAGQAGRGANQFSTGSRRKTGISRSVFF